MTKIQQYLHRLLRGTSVHMPGKVKVKKGWRRNWKNSRNQN